MLPSYAILGIFIASVAAFLTVIIIVVIIMKKRARRKASNEAFIEHQKKEIEEGFQPQRDPELWDDNNRLPPPPLIHQADGDSVLRKDNMLPQARPAPNKTRPPTNFRKKEVAGQTKLPERATRFTEIL
ncbi:hypothetical protein GGR57DRAFT_506846 [Xylariaceae sp. FL1272]|nr:hypothetical protein GGR57DRAFT_506846 [Xylariaceae sp. FL1272]